VKWLEYLGQPVTAGMFGLNPGEAARIRTTLKVVLGLGLPLLLGVAGIQWWNEMPPGKSCWIQRNLPRPTWKRATMSWIKRDYLIDQPPK